MNIVILVSGTFGDIVPHVALAKGLKAAGHDVTLAGGKNFKAFVERHGITFFGTTSDYETVMKSEKGGKYYGKRVT